MRLIVIYYYYICCCCGNPIGLVSLKIAINLTGKIALMAQCQINLESL